MELVLKCDKKIIKLSYNSYENKYNFLSGSPGTGCEEFEGVAIPSHYVEIEP